ncbi:MAG: DUF5801 repeats-in-toxin domain-containing protein, partial [Desulfobulbus sp.]|nr:DUF5801 repeats-in-toxin domain-containing protein [Desulfobulbus sp.]
MTYQLSTTDANTLVAVAADGRIVFTFSVNEISGEVTFNLNDQLDHQGYGDGEILPIQNLGEYVQVSVTDFDGDTATDTFAGLIEIQVENDVPMANVEALPIQAIVAEDGMSYATGDGSEGNKESGETNDTDEASGAAGSLAALFSAGADEGLGYGITTDGGILSGLDPLYSQGEMLTYSSTGSVLTASAGGREVFTFTVNDDGSWSFDLKDQLDHVDDGSNTENTALVSGADGSGSVAGIDFSSVLTATDFDGDTVTGSAAGTFVVTVVDDVPELEIMGEGVIGVVHEDALNATDSVDPDLSTGIPEPGAVFQDMVTLQLAPMVRTAPGADEPAPPVYSIVDPNDAASGLTSNGQVVTYQLSTTDANTLLAVAADGRTVFTFSVNETSGEVTFNLNDQLDHLGYGDSEILPIQNLGEYVQVSVTDFDGDTVTDTFAGLVEIQVENDVPTTDADDASLGYDIGGTVTESFNNLPGADELISDITFNLTEGAPVLSDVGQMTSDGTGLVWHIDQATGNLQAVKSGDVSSVPVFTVTTDKTPGGEYAGTYTVDIAGSVDNGSEAVSYTLSSTPSGNGPDVIITGAQTGYDPITIYADALQPTNGSVNVSSQGVGVNNQFIDSSEVLSFKFYSDSARTSPLVVTALGFTVNYLSNSELAHFTLWSDGSQVGTKVSKAGATREDNATNRTPITVTAVDAGEPAGATFDEIRFEGTGVENGYRLLISSLIVTTEPLDQQIAIPYTVTDADGDTDSSEFSLVFLNADQLTPSPVVLDDDSDGEGASATMNIMDAAALVPEEHQPADTNSESEEWSAEGDDSAGGGEGDGAGLPVTAADEEPSSGEAPDAAGDTGPDQVVGMTSAGVENSEVVDPVAGVGRGPESASEQPYAAAGDLAESSGTAAVEDNNEPLPDFDLQTGAAAGDSAQLAAADASAQPVEGP